MTPNQLAVAEVLLERANVTSRVAEAAGISQAKVLTALNGLYVRRLVDREQVNRTKEDGAGSRRASREWSWRLTMRGRRALRP